MKTFLWVSSTPLLLLLVCDRTVAQVRDPILPMLDTVVVTFHPKMTRAVVEGGFQLGDTLLVRYAFVPHLEPPFHERMLTRPGLGTDYVVAESLFVPDGTTLYYRYFVSKLGSKTSERYSCSDPEPCDRQIVLPNRPLTLWDTSWCIMCPQRMPHLMNARPLAHNVSVLYEVDVRPAWYQVASGDTLRDRSGMIHVRNRDSVLGSGVYINGTPTGGWESWGAALRGDTSRKMYDDGTHGDLVAGDTIFTRIILASPDSIDIGTKGQVGQLFKFSIGGGDNECDFGMAHEENVNDSDARFTIAEQWGSNDPIFYHCWDYGVRRPLTCVTAITEPPNLPDHAELYQCYPNPFNPATVVSYQLPEVSSVRLVVYDLLGREVSVLVNEQQQAGLHEVKWDAAELASGVYIYRLTAGRYMESRKMLVLK